MFRTGILALLLGLGIFPAANASFDQNFEYRSISENLPNLSSRRFKIDSEYFSNKFTYSFRDAYEVQWLIQKKLFLYSAGSLSGREFFVDERLKVESDLLPELGFKLLQFQQEDYEADQDHMIFEFPYRFGNFEFSGYMSISYAKQTDDFGGALTWKASPHHKVRIFHTWSDLEKNNRNEGTDRFINLPVGYGLKGEVFPANEKKGFLQYGFLFEPKFTWWFPDTNQNYNWGRSMATIYYIGEDYSVRAQWDQTDESTSNASSGALISQLTTRRLQFQLGHEFDKEILGAKPSLGVRYSSHIWQDGSNEIKYNAFVPQASLNWRNWALEYGYTYFESKGTWYNPTFNDKKSENRLNAYWNWIFSDSAILSFIFGFDLDFTSGDKGWEGGNGQFILLF